jgi:hypothetical protein
MTARESDSVHGFRTPCGVKISEYQNRSSTFATLDRNEVKSPFDNGQACKIFRHMCSVFLGSDKEFIKAENQEKTILRALNAMKSAWIEGSEVTQLQCSTFKEQPETLVSKVTPIVNRSPKERVCGRQNTDGSRWQHCVAHLTDGWSIGKNKWSTYANPC